MAKLKKFSNIELLTYFMEASRDDVFSAFAGLPRAEKQDGFVYIPGETPVDRRVLLVAHADTVWDDKKFNRIIPCWDGNICTGNGANGLGADDRAGVAMLWLMQKSGASILLTDEEESGCIGATKAADAIGERLSQHAFAIQMDRRGDQQAVFYNAATIKFQDWLIAKLGGGWRIERGSYSDVAEICPRIGVNGVNLSAGFLFEHRSSEMLFLDAWYRSVTAARKLVTWALEAEEIPDWGQPEKPVSRYSGVSIWRGGEWDSEEQQKWMGKSGQAVSKRGNGHSIQCVCDFCKENYYSYSMVRKQSASSVHSSKCQCLDCKRLREKAATNGDGTAADDGLPEGKWKPAKERGWRMHKLGNGAVVYDTWDGKPETLQLEAEWEKRERLRSGGNMGKDEAPEEEAPSTDASTADSKRVKDKDRTLLDALLEPDWDSLSEEDQQGSRRLAEKLAIGLVKAQRIDPDDDAFDAAEQFYENIILLSFESGMLNEYDTAIWESRCIFNHDHSDPRVEGFLDGCLEAMYSMGAEAGWDA